MAIGDLTWEEWAERHGYDVDDRESAVIYDRLVEFGTAAEDVAWWDIYEGNLVDDITMGAVGVAEALGLPLGDEEPQPLAKVWNVGIILLAAWVLIPLARD